MPEIARSAQPGDEIDEAVAYIADRDPALAGDLRGCDEREIATLELLAPYELPEIYIAFLGHMGRSMGWIAVQRMDFSYRRVLEAYRERDWHPPTPYTLIGIDDADVRFDPYLEAKAGSTRVVCFPQGDDFNAISQHWISELAGSLAEMICRPVFLAREFQIHPFRRERSRAMPQEGLLEKVDRFAEEMGFTPLGFSSHSGRYYTRGNAALSAVQPPGYTFSLKVSAQAEGHLVELDRRLLELTGADRLRDF